MALSQLNYEKRKPTTDEVRHISHAQVVAQESELPKLTTELSKDTNDQYEEK